MKYIFDAWTKLYNSALAIYIKHISLNIKFGDINIILRHKKHSFVEKKFP